MPLPSVRPNLLSRLMLLRFLSAPAGEEQEQRVIHPPLEPELTGRKRLRVQKRLFGKPLLVLQVEARHSENSFDRHGNSLSGSRYWLDAKVENMIELEFSDF